MENILKSTNGQSPNFEIQYAQSLQNILDNGVLTKNRTGTDTLVIQHQYFFLEKISQNFPILKGKKVFPKLALKELLWMMNGLSDVKWLNDRGVTYWNEWASTGKGWNFNIPIGTIGKSYGYQMRNFNGCDQLQDLLTLMKNDPESRRLIISLWNPSELVDTTLPPCVHQYHFNCEKTQSKIKDFDFNNDYYEVDLHVVARSEDSFLGQPYDFMSVAWKLTIICNLVSEFSGNVYHPRNIHYTANNYHLYVNHIDQTKQYLQNVTENKNNIINKQATVAIGNNYCRTLDEFLEISDNNQYKNFWINKFYTDQYESILAPIAI